MKKIFLDSDAIIALFNKGDSLHDKAYKCADLIGKQGYTTYTSTNILLEVCTIISQRFGKANGNRILDILRTGNIVIHPTEADILFAENLFRNHKSKNVSYSDCVSFAVMEKNLISEVFSFDIHFKKQGFRRFGVDG